MTSLDEIATLEKFDADGASILSLYLDVPAERQLRNGLKAALDDLVETLKGKLGSVEAADSMLAEVARVERLFDEPQGKGLVVFSCAQRELWRAEYLPVSVPDHIAFERKADVAPLLSVLDEYERYAVALVDKAGARLFTIYLGAIEERDVRREKDPPAKHDQGGWSQSRYQRHLEAQVTGHLKEAVDRLERMFHDRPFDRLVLAGPVEAVSELGELLPKPLAEKVIEAPAISMDASEADVLTLTLEAAHRAERQSEQEIIEQLSEAAGHRRGAQGLAATLSALYLGNIQTLVVADGVHMPGVECSNPECGVMERTATQTCPACGTQMTPTHDIVHRVMARTVGQAGTIEVVHGDAAEPLKAHDGIAAILRFPDPVRTGSL